MIILNSLKLDPGTTIMVRTATEREPVERQAFAYVTYADEMTNSLANGVAFWEAQEDGTHKLVIAKRDAVRLPS